MRSIPVRFIHLLLVLVSFVAVRYVFFGYDSSALVDHSEQKNGEQKNGVTYFANTKEEEATLQLLETYKQRHSISALKEQLDNANKLKRNLTTFETRGFVLGNYSCPQQAGNRLLHFANAFAFAVVTDRTLLWEYCSGKSCPYAGKMEDCERVLHRNGWIPSYQDWKPYLGDLIPVFPGSRHPGPKDILEVRTRLDLLPQNATVLDFGVMEHRECFGFLSNITVNNTALSPNAYQVAQTLLGAGSSFALGAMLDAAFSLKPSLERQGNNDGAALDQVVSVAIHSRHNSRTDRGYNTSLDEQCLEQTIREVKKYSDTINQQQHANTISPCSVAIMSDRKATIKALSKKVRALKCEVVTATHHRDWHKLKTSREHGKFAGYGFFEDLAMAQHAHNAVIETYGSSASELVSAFSAIHRTKRPLKEQSPMVICKMDRKRGACDCT